jgi:threonyl-tRNA synthetase
VIYALLEAEAMKMAQGKKAMLPVWLSPTQIRVIPVGDKHKARAVEVLGLLNQREVRADFDDRDEPLGKKIRDAQKEWVPYVIVIGDNEIASGKLSVNVRATDEKKEMSVAELVSVVEGENDGKPFEKSSLQQEISKRAII